MINDNEDSKNCEEKEDILSIINRTEIYNPNRDKSYIQNNNRYNSQSDAPLEGNRKKIDNFLFKNPLFNYPLISKEQNQSNELKLKNFQNIHISNEK